MRDIIDTRTIIRKKSDKPSCFTQKAIVFCKWFLVVSMAISFIYFVEFRYKHDPKYTVGYIYIYTQSGNFELVDSIGISNDTLNYLKCDRNECTWDFQKKECRN